MNYCTLLIASENPVNCFELDERNCTEMNPDNIGIDFEEFDLNIVEKKYKEVSEIDFYDNYLNYTEASEPSFLFVVCIFFDLIKNRNQSFAEFILGVVWTKRSSFSVCSLHLFFEWKNG